MWRMSLSPYGLFDFYHRLEPAFYVGTHSITVSPPLQFISDARSAVAAVSERSAEQIPAERGSIESGDPYQRPRQPHWAEERDASVSAPRWNPPTPTPINIWVPPGPQGSAAYAVDDVIPTLSAPQPANYPLPPYVAYPAPGGYFQYRVPGWYPAPPPPAARLANQSGAFGDGHNPRNDNHADIE
jgi:hypothetical protein